MKIVVIIASAGVLLASGCAATSASTSNSAPSQPAPVTLAGTSWTIATIDGRPVETARPTEVRFTKDRIEGSAGCNSFGGAYTLEDGTLTVTQVISTKMACIGPGMEVESKFFRIIAGASLMPQGKDALKLSATSGEAILSRAQ